MSDITISQLVPEGGWNRLDRPRIRPLTSSELGGARKVLIRIMVFVGGAKCVNLYRTLFKNFSIYFSFARLNVKLMPNGSLPRTLTELVILRVAWLTKSHYEWGQHVDIGLRAGLTKNQIAGVTLGTEYDGWTQIEELALQAVDDLHHSNIISTTTWNSLKLHLDEKKLIELLMLVGSYNALAGVLNSAGVELETKLVNFLTCS